MSKYLQPFKSQNDAGSSAEEAEAEPQQKSILYDASPRAQDAEELPEDGQTLKDQPIRKSQALPKFSRMSSMFDLKKLHIANKEEPAQRLKIVKSQFMDNLTNNRHAQIEVEDFVQMEQKLYDQQLKPVGQGV